MLQINRKSKTERLRSDDHKPRTWLRSCAPRCAPRLWVRATATVSQSDSVYVTLE